MSSSKEGQPLGCPNLAVLSFNNSFYDRTMGTGLFNARVKYVSCSCLGITHSKYIHKLDFPVPDWPVARFPALKYPLEDHVRENQEEERRCLTMRHTQYLSRSGLELSIYGIHSLSSLPELIDAWNRKGMPVAAVAGGDNMASRDFFQGLRDITPLWRWVMF
ncbi:hypothetical protein DPMN_033030 [Dreissena polymorpha]|uniref:Uncharacterized protein n=1 Tax=Dreissena polymorpha TaxID=45954 RepID=A0A9D4M5W6_DREPO|nr:hypothetical protein DPMN_033030 [Dreissena polymorpha]